MLYNIYQLAVYIYSIGLYIFKVKRTFINSIYYLLTGKKKAPLRKAALVPITG